MITSTRSQVRRQTVGEYNVLRHGAKRARKIIVKIAEGDVIQFSEHGGRKYWHMPIDTAFRYAVRLKAFADAAEKARNKPKKKKVRK